jgi:tRNA threonylcarbamoyladenosine biosynthesis protein TsaE
MREMEKTVMTLEDFEAEAARFVSELAPRGLGATLVTLSGELGAGKTTFTQVVAKTLGIKETVTSPTFVLEKIYALPHELGGSTAKFVRLVHIDAYRLESGAELAPLGFDELMRDADNLILLEWPEKVSDALPTPTVKISILAHENSSRTITYD